MPRLTRDFLAIVVLLAGTLIAPTAAHAHTELDFTLPAEGAAVGEPVSEIRIGFTEPVTLVGPGFRVLTPQGIVIEPFAVTDDDTVFRLQLDPPLVGGAVGVQYEVAAADGHVLQGSFAFTVVAEALPTTSPATTPATTPATATPTAAVLAPAGGTGPTAAPTTAPTTAAPVATTESVLVVVAAPTSGAVATSAADAEGDGEGGGGSQSSMIIAIAGAVAAAALGFVIVRSRRHTV